MQKTYRKILYEELQRLVYKENFKLNYANDILELFDDEINDGHSDSTAYDKAMQDIDNVQNGEWDL
jgi:hypothetical protein|tara:strand:+ start:318 stop:515 length:198 start_codon:yes stop_codon:yes gene_type:complete